MNKVSEFKKYTKICTEYSFKEEKRNIEIEEYDGESSISDSENLSDLNFNDFLNVINNEIGASINNNKKYLYFKENRLYF